MKRILIKLSGEGLSSKNKKLIVDPVIVNDLAKQIKLIVDKKIEVGIVVGGGNFWRGSTTNMNNEISRNRSDYIGMLATVMNALAIQSAFETLKIKARIQTSLFVDPKIAENYINEKALKALENKEVVIFAGGIGRPYFTTDTTAALVALEIHADTILMGKNGVKGIYDCDPKTNFEAKKFDEITYDEIISKNLKVMDTTAAVMARDNQVDLIVFDITEENALFRALEGKIAHTKVKK